MMVKRALETAALEEDGEFSGASWVRETIATCSNTGSTHLRSEYPLQYNNKGLCWVERARLAAILGDPVRHNQVPWHGA